MNVPFDKYETAVLIREYMLVEDGILKPKEAVSKVSQILRKRAIDSGKTIDDTFRDEAGITTQMWKIKCIVKKNINDYKYTSFSKMFIDMVDMYFHDREQFENLLSSERGTSYSYKDKITERKLPVIEQKKQNQYTEKNRMQNQGYIRYLNSLHNYNAQNSNAYGEKNVGSKFFSEVAVKVGLCTYIEKQLQEKEPHVLILTGHAGDGKTSIMYQVLKDFNVAFQMDEKISDITLPTGKICRCIKDYSELSDSEKRTVLKECVRLPEEDKYVFMVSNTGPLINTFETLFEDAERESAKMKLIDAMDSNSGAILDFYGFKISIINVALVDNTNFAVSFLSNIVKESLWEKCKDCRKSDYCHIYRNRNLVVKNEQRVYEFIKDHYIWLVEHGTRLTIRSMTEQLAYMITGGIECENVVSMDKYKMLFFNLFFGYVGLKNNDRANSIIAVREAKQCGYDKKRLRADEKLLIDCDYKSAFGKDLEMILIEAYNRGEGNLAGWPEFLRRAYIFTNIITDKQQQSNDSEDIFSKQFENYLRLRSGKAKPTKADTNIIIDALSMMYLGRTAEDSANEIPITLSKSSGLTQNVQLVTGYVQTRRMSLKARETKDSTFDEDHKRYELLLEVNKHTLKSIISLPMINYFEELRNGIISTNIDPQLSHGVESLKAQLSKECDDEDNSIIEMIVLRNKKNEDYRLEIGEDLTVQRV